MNREERGSSGLSEPTRPRRSGPCQSSRSPGPCPLPSHSLPPSRQPPMFEIPVFLLSFKRTLCFHSAAFLRALHGHLDSARPPRHPATGRTPGPPRAARARRRATFPATSQQALRPPTRPGGPRAPLVVSPPGMELGMLAGGVAAGGII